MMIIVMTDLILACLFLFSAADFLITQRGWRDPAEDLMTECECVLKQVHFLFVFCLHFVSIVILVIHNGTGSFKTWKVDTQTCLRSVLDVAPVSI